MTKQEFIHRLRTALSGRVSPGLVQEHVNYYEDYINTRVRMGYSESDVLDTLGDPRLIAKTIIETSGEGGNSYENADYQSDEYRSTGYQEHPEVHNHNIQKLIHLPRWVWGIISIVIVVLVLGLIFSILSFFAPLIVTFLVVVFLVKLFRDWLN